MSDEHHGTFLVKSWNEKLTQLTKLMEAVSAAGKGEAKQVGRECRVRKLAVGRGRFPGHTDRRPAFRGRRVLAVASHDSRCCSGRA